MLMSKAAIDQCDDLNQQVLHRLSKLVELPEYVKAASLLDVEATKQLPNNTFADPINRKFPLHTKAATWLSQAYFTESSHLYTTQDAALVQAKIQKAARYWGIDEHVKTAKAALDKHASTAPPELTDADYAMIIKQANNQLRLFPIHSAENIKKSASELYNNRRLYPYEYRKTAARKILHKAAQLNVTDLAPELCEYLTKAAGFGSALPKQAAEKLGYRVLMIPAAEHDLKVKTAKLVKTLANMPDIPSTSDMEKLASITDRLDRKLGFFNYYDQGVETPEELFFALTTKKAAEIRDGYLQLITGTIIPFMALQGKPLHKVASALGNDFVRAVTDDNSLDINLNKFGKIAATLPMDDARLLERALVAAGVTFKQLTLDEVLG